MPKFQPPNVPFVEAQLVGEKQKPTAIALDLSMTTSDKGAALGIATSLHRRNAPPNSYHYVVDEAETYRGVWDNFAAYKSPYRAINVLVCADPVEDERIWDKPSHFPVKHRASELVADLILAHKIRPRYISGADEERWMKRRTRRRGGVIVRVPGEWPHEAFLIDVKAHLVMKTS